MVLVDSSVWIEAMRLNGALQVKLGLENLLGEYEAAFCGPVKLEVLGGARRETRARMAEYFSNLPYLSTGDGIWERAKELSWKLRDQGYAIPWNDLLIVAIALMADCRIYAADEHFTWISRETDLRLYEPGPGGKFIPE